MNELHALRVFCQVVEMEGFSQAATKMGLSPASVTYSINQLEKQFGQPLFKRSTRR
ncbi:TPA: LysR family transcriptional regulator, partial [Serratia marcescens]